MSARFSPRTRMLGPAFTARVAQWLQRSPIKSIQRGTITIAAAATSNTATITSVVVGNTRLVYLGLVGAADATPAPVACRIELTNATTITATVNAASAAGDRIVGFEVLEYWPGAIRTVQRGTITTTAAASGTATLATTLQSTAKAAIDNLGFTTDSVQTSPSSSHVRMDITNTTTVTATGVGGVDRTCGYQVTEYW